MPRPLTAAAALGAIALMVATGWAVAHGYTSSVLIALAVVGLLILALAQRGLLVGMLLIAAMNSVPFVDTSQVVKSKLTVADVAIITLFVVACLWRLLDAGDVRRNPLSQALSHAGGLLLLWWTITLIRSVTSQHVSALHAASFGRDFLYFALLLMVLPRVALTQRDIDALLIVLACAACLFAIGQIATATGAGQSDGLIHFRYTVVQSGLTRVYSDATDLVMATLAAAVGACVIGRRHSRFRAVAVPIALLLAVSIIVQLTRARWLGLVLGLFVVGLWITIHSDTRLSKLLRRRVALMLGLAGMVLALVLVTVPSVLSSGTLLQRVFSIFSDLEGGTGTVAVREAATKTATNYLGGSWPTGLGFVPPSAHFYVGLPEGSLRDTDLGVLGAAMTTGVIGALLIYTPMILALFHCLRRPANTHARYNWLRYGGAVWIVAVLLSSATLVTLFSASGLALAAVVVTLVSNPLVSEPLETRRRMPKLPRSSVEQQANVPMLTS